MFQHNNARAHTAHATQDFLHQQGINVKDWPAFPPDMSPIGHARDKLGRLVYRRNAIGNLHQLEATLHKKWAMIPQTVFQNPILSMRRRIVAYINARGGHT